MPPLILAVHGTWAIRSGWWQPDGLWARAAGAHGLALPEDPFFWSGELGGVLGRGLDPWRAAGAALRWYCLAYGLESPNVVSHSHGIQVVAWAAELGQAFAGVLDVSGPVRDDMRGPYEDLRRQSALWCHTYDENDSTLIQGEAGGTLLVHPDQPLATENVNLTDRGFLHSGLFDDLPAWGELGLWVRLGGTLTAEVQKP